jgi:hypothetical protein
MPVRDRWPVPRKFRSGSIQLPAMENSTPFDDRLDDLFNKGMIWQ